jgi:hypothetical protein
MGQTGFEPWQQLAALSKLLTDNIAKLHKLTSDICFDV